MRFGEDSFTLGEADPLVVGEVPKPTEETGDRTGDGERFTLSTRDVRPATYIESLFPVCSACSDCTTSAKEMKLSRRTSAESRVP